MITILQYVFQEYIKLSGLLQPPSFVQKALVIAMHFLCPYAFKSPRGIENWYVELTFFPKWNMMLFITGVTLTLICSLLLYLVLKFCWALHKRHYLKFVLHLIINLTFFSTLPLRLILILLLIDFLTWIEYSLWQRL